MLFLIINSKEEWAGPLVGLKMLVLLRLLSSNLLEVKGREE
jgi:hypothetical protein